MRFIAFKTFLNETQKIPLPAIETTGLSSNQANTAIQNNNTPNYSGNPVKEETDNVEKLHHELSEHYWHQAKHKETLHSLTSGSRHLNKHLHKKYEAGETNVHTTQTKQIDKALTQHKTPHEFHTYTGVTREPKPGTYHHPAYLHTSLKKHVARGFAREHYVDGKTHMHILKIHVPKGHHGSYVSSLSDHPNEHEFILPRNTKLKIHPHHETEVHYGTHYHIHHTTIEE